MLKQLSIFAENKKGTMQQITQILFENDVNILGSVNNDSAEYGIVRMVVSDPDKAEQALQAAGYMTRQTDVLGPSFIKICKALSTVPTCWRVIVAIICAV